MLKKALLAILAAMVLPQATRAADGPIKIGMTVPGLKFPFFVIMKNDAEKAAAKLGATIVFADARTIRPSRPPTSRTSWPRASRPS